MKEILNYGKQLWDFKDVNSMIDEFMELYESRPVVNNAGGMSSTHLFWTWYVAKKIHPENIIESGVFKGQGTWIFRQACPNANIFSIDPFLDQRKYIDKETMYFTEDFSMIEWEKYLRNDSFENTLVFFDDHQNAYMRMQQLKWQGFFHAMFEDNYPVKQGDCYSLKKIFSGCGFSHDGINEIPPNDTHASYVMKNIETYTTLPPLYKPEKTRWGDVWDESNYPTENSILAQEKLEKHPAVKAEAGGYTWICYVKLK